MGIRIDKALPSAAEIRQMYPITAEHHIPENRQLVKDVLAGKDKRLLMVIGPCSVSHKDSLLKYSDFLAALREEIQEKIVVVLRTYIQKPRTTVGWPGYMVQPDPLGEPDVVRGILGSSEIMDRTAKQHPLADEMLFTHNAAYFDPYLSYSALGARSAEDMEHRYIASGVDSAVGVKNSTSGDIEIGVNGIQSVQHPHTFTFQGNQVTTTGNPSAHLVLRGGTHGSNYDPHSIAKAHKLLQLRAVKNPAIIVDASHDNSRNGSGKDPLLQEMVIQNVMMGILQQREEYEHVRGFMVESNLKGGSQKIAPGMDPEISITDPCISKEDTRRILLDLAALR